MSVTAIAKSTSTAVALTFSAGLSFASVAGSCPEQDHIAQAFDQAVRETLGTNNEGINVLKNDLVDLQNAVEHNIAEANNKGTKQVVFQTLASAILAKHPRSNVECEGGSDEGMDFYACYENDQNSENPELTISCFSDPPSNATFFHCGEIGDNTFTGKQLEYAVSLNGRNEVNQTFSMESNYVDPEVINTESGNPIRVNFSVHTSKQRAGDIESYATAGLTEVYNNGSHAAGPMVSKEKYSGYSYDFDELEQMKQGLTQLATKEKICARAP